MKFSRVTFLLAIANAGITLSEEVLAAETSAEISYDTYYEYGYGYDYSDSNDASIGSLGKSGRKRSPSKSGNMPSPGKSGNMPSPGKSGNMPSPGRSGNSSPGTTNSTSSSGKSGNMYSSSKSGNMYSSDTTNSTSSSGKSGHMFSSSKSGYMYSSGKSGDSYSLYTSKSSSGKSGFKKGCPYGIAGMYQAIDVCDGSLLTATFTDVGMGNYQWEMSDTNWGACLDAGTSQGILFANGTIKDDSIIFSGGKIYCGINANTDNATVIPAPEVTIVCKDGYLMDNLGLTDVNGVNLQKIYGSNKYFPIAK